MNETDLSGSADGGMRAAPLRTRAVGYAIDMVLFAAIATCVAAIAGFILLRSTDSARGDATDPDCYLFFGIIGLGVPIVWTLLCLAVLVAQSRTGGQYVVGVHVARANGQQLSLRGALLWWFCLNPLLFSWPMAIVSGVPITLVLAPTLGRRAILGYGVLGALCIATPVVAFVSAAFDAESRALQDRIVGTRVVRDDESTS